MTVAPAPEEPIASWSFAPRALRESRADREAAFRQALGLALRTAHGLCADVALEIRSGPEPRVLLHAFDPGSARWALRVLARAYGPSQWSRVPPSLPREDSHETRFWARRHFDWPEPLVPPAPAGSIWDGWVTALSSAPEVVRLAWRWKAVPVSAPRWWDQPTTVSPPPVPQGRFVPNPRSARWVNPANPVPISRPLFGRLRMSVTFGEGRLADDRQRATISALEAVARSERGNSFSFRPLRSILGGGTRSLPGLLVSVEEWERFWPSPECPAEGDRASLGLMGWVLPLGRTSTGAVVGPVIEPHQGRHLAVLGETGMGKSSLLVSLGHRALGASGGVVFDPLGETVRTLRDELTEEELHRTLWIGPEGETAGVNALEGIGPGPFEDPIRSERRINDLVHALRRVRAGRYEESSYWGPRLEEMVTRAIRAAAAFPRGTLADAHTLLETSGRLGRPVPGPAMEAVRELADRIRDRPEDRDGAQRLLHEVVRSPVLRRMLCEPEPRLRTSDLVAPGRITLISGDAATVGEATARYLLSVYLALVWSELLARDSAAKTFVILDEAQWFSHESLGEMLRLGRRCNVHVVLATQAIASLPPAVGEAVWTNVSDFVAFRGSPEEAREFSRATRGVAAEDLLALPRGEAAVLLGKGHFVRWLRTTRVPDRPRDLNDPLRAARTPLSPSPPDSRPGGSEGPARDPTPAEPFDEERVNAVFRFLSDRAEHVGPGEPLEVSLDELRREVDPDGDGVRRAGSLLGRRGIVRRVEKPELGPYWVVAPDRVPELRLRSAPVSADASRPPQPS